MSETKEDVKIAWGPEYRGCAFDDKIYVPLSPTMCEDILSLAKENALQSKDYVRQGAYRAIADIFEKAYRSWSESCQKAKRKGHRRTRND